MKRLHIIAEGQTEEKFINETLTPHLAAFDVFTDVHCVTTRRDRRKNKIYRGGLLNYSKLKRDIYLWIQQEGHKQEVYFTTMIDFYAFPTSESPYSEQIRKIQDIYQRIASLENAICENIDFDRFIPYVQLHEFETFIFCNVQSLNEIFINKNADIDRLERSVSSFTNPEEINEGQHTAPSKRIIQFIPEYEDLKTTAGPLIACDLGINLLKERCKHFKEWIERLESLNE